MKLIVYPINFCDVLQEHKKRKAVMCPVVTTPQEFQQIVFKHISRSTCLAKTSLGDPPCILDILSMSTGVRVNEVQGVVDCEMLEPSSFRQGNIYLVNAC